MDFVKVQIYNKQYNGYEEDLINFSLVERVVKIDGEKLRLFMVSGAVYIIEDKHGYLARRL